MKNIKTYIVVKAEAHEHACAGPDIERVKAHLTSGNFVWFPMNDTIDNGGCSLIIYNLSKEDASNIIKKFGLVDTSWRKLEKEIDLFDEQGEEFLEKMRKHDEIIGKVIASNLNRIGEGESYLERKLRQMLSDSTSGRGRWEARGALYSGYRRIEI